MASIRNKRDNHIRDLLDGVKPEQVFSVFEEILQVLEQQGQLANFRSFSDTLLMALDGTEYFSSSQIHCPQCSTRCLKSGETHYFHSVVTPVIVCPGQTQVIPLMPEFIVPQDGHDKQDCETAAAKRWLLQHGQRYNSLNVTVLGDDLYCRQPLCQQLLAQQFNFILVCRPESHTTLYDHLEGIDRPTDGRDETVERESRGNRYLPLSQRGAPERWRGCSVGQLV